MPRVLILCLHRPNRSPSQRFRFEQYLPFLGNKGYTFDFSFLLNEREDKIYYSPGNYPGKLKIVLSAVFKRFFEVLSARKYDLIFVQREAFMLGSSIFERLLASKKPLIFDFDDSIWLPNISEANKKLGFLKDASKTSRIISSSRLVFAGNEFLADYARRYNKEVVVVPTTIETRVYKNTGHVNKGSVCIGWSGSFSTLEHFETIIPALKQLKEKYENKIRFKIIGDGRYYCKELETQGEAWNEATEVRDLSFIDIGIMPLPNSEWTKGKCGLKGLQYMALGIPTLMSPVGVNRDIIQNGVNGFLPNSIHEWIRYISLLIDNEGLRNIIGKAGMETVEEKYSTQRWENTYLYYFDRVTKTANSESQIA